MRSIAGSLLTTSTPAGTHGMCPMKQRRLPPMTTSTGGGGCRMTSFTDPLRSSLDDLPAFPQAPRPNHLAVIAPAGGVVAAACMMSSQRSAAYDCQNARTLRIPMSFKQVSYRSIRASSRSSSAMIATWPRVGSCSGDGSRQPCRRRIQHPPASCPWSLPVCRRSTATSQWRGQTWRFSGTPAPRGW